MMDCGDTPVMTAVMDCGCGDVQGFTLAADIVEHHKAVLFSKKKRTGRMVGKHNDLICYLQVYFVGTRTATVSFLPCVL